MKSVGEILRHAREKKKISLGELAEQTRVSQRYLEAIEQNNFEILPNEVSTRGFLSLYAGAVGMDPQSVIALYRRDVPTATSDQDSLRSHFFVFGHSHIVRFVFSAITCGVIVGTLVFAGTFLRRLRQAPPLRVTNPQNDQSVRSPVEVRGSSASDAVVQVDGEAVGVNQDGLFSKEVELGPGAHVITVKAIGRNGKERLQQVLVTVENIE